jgi:four helix bundle protein
MFVAYDISLQLIRALRPVVTTLREHDRDLASQLRRAASSISLALAEGRDRRDGDRRRLYEVACGSASEVRAALDTADAWGWPVALEPSRLLLDRLGGLLYGLTHRRR